MRRRLDTLVSHAATTAQTIRRRCARRTLAQADTRACPHADAPGGMRIRARAGSRAHAHERIRARAFLRRAPTRVRDVRPLTERAHRLRAHADPKTCGSGGVSCREWLAERRSSHSLIDPEPSRDSMAVRLTFLRMSRGHAAASCVLCMIRRLRRRLDTLVRQLPASACSIPRATARRQRDS